MDLTDRSTHFEFGENWLSYAQTINDESVAWAERSLEQMLQLDVRGKSFLDIGSGSGLFSLAALSLGAVPLYAIDIDENSVTATQQLLQSRAPTSNWRVEKRSILEPGVPTDQFDVVYSWGVLHHTGDMWRAIECAAARVRPGGTLAIALYRKTYLCPLWTIEKRLYTKHPKMVAPVANALFKTLWVSAQLLLGRNPLARIRSYRSHRGMSWAHNVNDWVGGYPYESALFEEVVTFLARRGFTLRHSNARRRKEIGVLGSGCDEYVFSNG
jgi:SAM-dependent methyltransferase